MAKATILIGAALFGVVWGWLGAMVLSPPRSARGLLAGASTAAAAAATTLFLADAFAAFSTACGLFFGLLAHAAWRRALRGLLGPDHVRG